MDGFLTLDSYENSLDKLAFCNMAKHGNMVKFSTLSLKAEISYGVTSSCNIVFTYNLACSGRWLSRCCKQEVNCIALAEPLLDWVGELVPKWSENPTVCFVQSDLLLHTWWLIMWKKPSHHWLVFCVVLCLPPGFQAWTLVMLCVVFGHGGQEELLGLACVSSQKVLPSDSSY